MAKQVIGIGTTANDGTGDTLRDAMDKINDNFTELYGSSVTTHYKVANLTANSTNTLAGSSFTPAITAEPFSIRVFDNGSEIQGAITGFVQNGANYDITLYVTDSFTNAKIKVIC